MNIVEVRDLSKIFQENAAVPVTALGAVSLEVEEGAFAALCGPSGSGKTTLLNLIGCLDQPSTGSIFLDGEEVSRLDRKKQAELRLRKIGFIFQDFNLIPMLTVLENVGYPLWLQGIRSEERKTRAAAICERFGIGALIHRRPSQISRGQQQRVAIARAVVHKPRIVLGDEFTANLDHKTGSNLMDFLRELNRNEKITFLYATHDPVMMERASRIVRMQDGQIIKEAHG